jgi:tRNA(Ile)-lysidine synthase
MSAAEHTEKATAEIATAVSTALTALPAQSHICVAFSGGEDSSVLLHALASARTSAAQPFQLSARHVHHGLSANADAWAVHCSRVCRQIEVPFSVTHVTVDRKSKQGIEAAAREARYRGLFEQRAPTVTHFALAHHALDQAETVLLQLLRGAGPEGLAAMAHDAVTAPHKPTSHRAATAWRPLLGIGKSAIIAYAKQHAITSVIDESNVDVRFARNRMRHAVWPTVSGAFPGAETTLARAAKLQAEAAELQRDLAIIDATHCITDDSRVIALQGWRALSSARRRNLLRYWIAQHDCPALSLDRLSEWDRQLFAVESEHAINLPTPIARTSVRVYRDHVYWVRESMHAARVAWLGARETSFGDGVVSFEATALRESKASLLRAPRAGETWTLRPRRPGDAIALSANSGRVTFKNVVQNAGVAPWLRVHWPVLDCDGVVAALPGICVAVNFAPACDETAGHVAWKPDR